MPIYEYECSSGHRFEEYRQIWNRNNVICPECGGSATIRISVSRHRLAEPLPVYDGYGRKVYEFGDVPKVRPPTPPEELVRVGELSNNADRFG